MALLNVAILYGIRIAAPAIALTFLESRTCSNSACKLVMTRRSCLPTVTTELSLHDFG